MGTKGNLHGAGYTTQMSICDQLEGIVQQRSGENSPAERTSRKTTDVNPYANRPSTPLRTPPTRPPTCTADRLTRSISAPSCPRRGGACFGACATANSWTGNESRR